MDITLSDALEHFKKQMGTRPTNSSTQLTVSDTISKCLVVLFLKKVTAEVATTKYMDKLLGVSPESIKQVKDYQTQDLFTRAVFVEMSDARVATFVHGQWKNNNTDQNVILYTASDFLCRVAAKKFQQPSFNNPGSAFHALFKPNTLAALMFQQPQTVSVQVHSHTAPIQPQSRNNIFRFPSHIPQLQHQQRPPLQQQQSRPPPINDVFTSAAVTPGPSYPLSAPIQQQQYNYSAHATMPTLPQTYNPSIPSPMYEQPVSSPYLISPQQQQFQQQLQQQQQFQQNSYYNFPTNQPYDNFIYPPPNQNGYYQ